MTNIITEKNCLGYEFGSVGFPKICESNDPYSKV